MRRSAPRDERVKAVQEILRRQLNKPALRIERRQVEREVVVARGRLALAPAVAAGGNKIRIAAGEELGEVGHGSGQLKLFLERLGDLAGRPVIDETQSGGQHVSWTLDESASEPADDPAKVRELLVNVSRQTGLRLETARRPVTVYVLESEPARK